MASRIALALAIGGLALGTALPGWGASSINTTQPVQGVPYSAAPIRQNFGAAANDINALQSLNAGASAPSNPAPGTWWLDTSGITTYELKIWDGRGNQFLHVATLDTINNIWVPPVGGGLLPTILSASTTNIGSVPQASLYVSGNNSIQSFGSSAPVGAIKVLLFTGTPTLVNVPGSLSLPNGTDITQAAGDAAIALQISQGNWQIIFDSRASTVMQTRQMLTGTANLYVASSGSDANNNCTNNLSPCQTIQHAANIAITDYDLGNGQSLIINVTSGSYPAGVSICGPLVGAATTVTSPSAEFPISGLQIIGAPLNPSAVVIADTSAPGFIPAVFSACQGTTYTVSGFTVSSINGYGLIASSGALLQFSNLIFGTVGGPGQIGASTNGIVNATGSYTVSGNASNHINATNGGIVRLNPPSLMTVTLIGPPTFSGAFVSLTSGKAIINSGVVNFAGTATGPKFLLQGSSLLNTSSGSPTFLPGSVNGAILFYSDYIPAIPLASITGVTGLGSGGAAVPDPIVGAYDVTGSIQLNPGTGAGSSGQVILNFNTHEFRNCSATLANGPTFWASGATATGGDAANESLFTISWSNNGTPLTAAQPYYVKYTCPGVHL